MNKDVLPGDSSLKDVLPGDSSPGREDQRQSLIPLWVLTPVYISASACPGLKPAEDFYYSIILNPGDESPGNTSFVK